MPPTPSPQPPPADPTPLPQLPAPDFSQYTHGISLLGGWLPLTIDAVALLALVAVVGWRTRRWRLLWLPLCVLVGVIGALAARTLVNSEGLASDPAPLQLWIWTGLFVASVAVAVVGWRGSSWWRRGLSVLAVPLTAMSALIALNQWVGYYPSVQTAWGALTAGPLPNQIDAAELPGLRNTVQTSGKLVEIDTGSQASGFAHRNEYVYLPPAWFAGPTPPKLPVIMMIAGEFNTPADWIRTGNALPIIDRYTSSHGGQAPIFAFVDSGGRFNNDTECVDGPRGNAADHLTKDVRPYVVDTFGASDRAANWAVVGWSMGGTCAIDLTVMHPDLFSTFEDIAGDHGPTSGTKDQTIDRLYGGDAAAWDRFDPRTVMQKHGPYEGVAGWFEDTVKPADGTSSFGGSHRPQSDAPLGFGGHDEFHDSDEAGAADDLCGVARSVGITCEVHRIISYHTWQFAERAFSDALPWLIGEITTPAPTSRG
ncbi:alpha/beta hydrolase [Mycolicibacterium anyangense]|uniref:alpha/beta hydrolase n=1 Tax=Mycolicibacterium anyangense TaxID=1431246 RepID=UPI0013D48E66|nr:alpha/beta hydrolase-fold protein [Mycolicibacterium anyangense]